MTLDADLYDPSAPADRKAWWVGVKDGCLVIRTFNDASSACDAVVIRRRGHEIVREVPKSDLENPA